MLLLLFLGSISLAVVVAEGITFAGSAPAPSSDLSLWYRLPASDWESQALPIGNGYIGGMVFGGVDQEHIQLNEKSLWSGGPGEYAGYTGGNKSSLRVKFKIPYIHIFGDLTGFLVD